MLLDLLVGLLLVPEVAACQGLNIHRYLRQFVFTMHLLTLRQGTFPAVYFGRFQSG